MKESRTLQMAPDRSYCVTLAKMMLINLFNVTFGCWLFSFMIQGYNGSCCSWKDNAPICSWTNITLSLQEQIGALSFSFHEHIDCLLRCKNAHGVQVDPCIWVHVGLQVNTYIRLLRSSLILEMYTRTSWDSLMLEMYHCIFNRFLYTWGF